MENKELFKKYNINDKLKLSNRIVMAPMTRKINNHGLMNNDNKKYYVKRVKGGVGLIISEGIVVTDKSSSNDVNLPNFYTSESIKSWKEIVSSVHKNNGKIIAQIWHVGSDRIPSNSPYNVNNIDVNSSKKDIERVINSFGDTARIAEKIGFDGVEIHAAHGYFIDEFLWDKTNNRTDDLGGKSISERSEILRKIINNVKSKTTNNFVVGLRISQWKVSDFDAKLFNSEKELKYFIDSIPLDRIDYIHVSTRRFWESAFDKSSLTLAGWVKKLSNITTIAVGSVGLDNDFLKALTLNEGSKITGLTKLNNLLDNNETDLIAIGRTLISNPDWPNLIKNNLYDKVKDFDANDLKYLN